MQKKEQNLADYLTQQVPILIEHYQIPGVAIGTIKDGHKEYLKYYGFKDKKQTRPISEDTLFRIESITKMLTAYGVMKLVEEKEIALTDSITQYLTRWTIPETQFNEKLITFQNLLSHNSGLPFGIYKGYDNDLIIPSLVQTLDGYGGAPVAKPGNKPGDVFEYANQGYALLELIIEDITQTSFEDYMEENILSPLNMQHSTFKWNSYVSETITNFYDECNKLVLNFREPFQANGGLYSTLSDIVNLQLSWQLGRDEGFIHPAVLSTASIKSMHSQWVPTEGFYKYFSDAYGLGHFVDYSKEGKKIVFHPGQGAGAVTLVLGVPEEGIGIVILTNSARSWQFVAAVLDQWLKFHHVSWNGMNCLFINLKIAVVVVLTAINLIFYCLILKLFFSNSENLIISNPFSKGDRLKSFILFFIAFAICFLTGFSKLFDRGIWILPNLIGPIKVTFYFLALLIFLLAFRRKKN